jgi:3'(2'), 5'-bisphosphate nucleotidase
VAESSADAYVAPHYAGKRWDVCPTDVLVVAAGGRVTDARGGALDYRAPGLANDQGLVASNGRVHDEILARLAAI